MGTQSLKNKIMTLIQNGLNNDEIKLETGASNSHIVHTRMEYNSVVPKAMRKPSVPKLTAPKEGTVRRIIYDYMTLYPNARFTEVVEATGCPSGTVGSVRHRYFSPKAIKQRMSQ